MGSTRRSRPFRRFGSVSRWRRPLEQVSASTHREFGRRCRLRSRFPQGAASIFLPVLLRAKCVSRRSILLPYAPLLPSCSSSRVRHLGLFHSYFPVFLKI